MLLGKRNDDVMAPGEAAVWREALEDVLRSGRQRAIECTMATPEGPRRFASVISALARYLGSAEDGQRSFQKSQDRAAKQLEMLRRQRAQGKR